MAYFEQIAQLNYLPQEFSYEDLQESDAIAMQYQEAERIHAYSPTRAEKLDEIMRRYKDVSPITKGLAAIDKALYEAIRFAIQNADQMIASRQHVEQARAIKGLCDNLLGIRQGRETHQPITLPELDDNISSLYLLEEREAGDYASYWVDSLRNVLAAHHRNLAKFYEPSFEKTAKDSAALRAPVSMPSAPAMQDGAWGYDPSHGAPSAPYAGAQDAYAPYPNGSLYPSQSDLSDRFAGMGLHPQGRVNYSELAAEIGDMYHDTGPIDPEQALIAAAIVREALVSARSAALKRLTESDDSGLLAVDEFCTRLEYIGADRLGITIKVFKEECAKISNLDTKEAKPIIDTFLGILVTNSEAVRQQRQPAPREKVAAAAPGPLGAPAAKPSEHKVAVIEKLIAAFDEYIGQRAKVKDKFGQTRNYESKVGQLFSGLSFLPISANSFSEESRAIDDLKFRLLGASPRLSLPEEKALKAVLCKGNPFAIIQKFIRENPEGVQVIFGKRVDTPQEFVDLLFLPLAHQTFGMKQ